MSVSTVASVKITDNSGEFIDAKDQAAARALEAIGLLAEGYAKALSPVDTGRLRSSISHDTDDDTAYIGTNVEYAAYVELGTQKTKAQPYLRPAVEDHGTQYRQLAEQHLKEG